MEIDIHDAQDGQQHEEGGAESKKERAPPTTPKSPKEDKSKQGCGQWQPRAKSVGFNVRLWIDERQVERDQSFLKIKPNGPTSASHAGWEIGGANGIAD